MTEIPELVYEALGTEMFTDENRQSDYREYGYAALTRLTEVQRHAHIAALRGLASMRRQYAGDPAGWEPDKTETAELRDVLRPAAVPLMLLNNVSRYIADDNCTPELGEGTQAVAHLFDDLALSLARVRPQDQPLHGHIEIPRSVGRWRLHGRLIDALCGDSDLKALFVVWGTNGVIKTASGRGLHWHSEHPAITACYEGHQDTRGGVVMTTYNMLHQLLRSPDWPQERYDLVLAEDAHADTLPPLYRQALEQFAAGKVAISTTAARRGMRYLPDELLPEPIHWLSDGPYHPGREYTLTSCIGSYGL